MQTLLVHPHVCELGEGPVWDERTGSLYWVDILRGNVNRYATRSQSFSFISLDTKIGSVTISDDDGLIGATTNGFVEIDWNSQSFNTLDHPEKHIQGNRFNDGKCDRNGRFWAGSMALDEQPGAGSLYMLRNDLSVEKKLSGSTISNGLAWSNDDTILYYIDTPSRRVSAFDYDRTTGAISNDRTVIPIPEQLGFPDGMTIDEEGMLWIAIWGGWCITRWNPDTGTMLDKISLPVSQVTSCTFGGDDLSDLYITSASIGLTEDDRTQQPDAGKLFVIKHCGYRGQRANRFKKQMN